MTGGIHLTTNDIFKSIYLKQCKLTHEKLAREKMLCKLQEKNQVTALEILERKGENPSCWPRLTSQPSSLGTNIQRWQV